MRKQSLRILHLTGELPYIPGASGGSTRQFHLLQGLASRGHEITVVSPVSRFQREEVDLSRLYRDAGLRLVAVHRPRTRPAQLASALVRKPSMTLSIPALPYYGLQARMLWTFMRSAVLRELAGDPPGIITVEHDFAATWAELLPQRGLVPKVITLHNFSPDYYRSRAGASTGLRATLLRAEEHRMMRYVRTHLPAYDRVIAVSERDADLARRVFSGQVTVIPNGTELPTNGLPESDGHSVLFTGTLSHPPNEEGAAWLVNEVWPRLRKEVPDATLRIVGRKPPRSVLSLASRDRGVEVIGDVPSLQPYYAGAAVVVAPLRSGGGTRLKVLDALAAGRATVATAVAVEGLSIADGDGIVVRDDASSFARAVSELLERAHDRSELAACGRMVVSRFAWPKLAEHLEEALRSTIDEHEGRVRRG